MGSLKGLEMGFYWSARVVVQLWIYSFIYSVSCELSRKTTGVWAS